MAENSMKRLFVGIGFDAELASAVQVWAKKLRKTADKKELHLKWSLPENYHVTLVFLGETAEAEIPSVREKIDAVARTHAGFSLKIRGMDAFPNQESGRVLYLGVQRSQALLDVQAALEESLLGKVRPDDGYVPHLTLARLRNPAHCKDLLSPFKHIDLGKQKVSEIALFESVQTGPFRAYLPLHKVGLSGTSE